MLSLLLTFALAGQASFTPAAEKVFGDWAIACDNVKRCEATALMPDTGWDGQDPPQALIRRDAGPNGAISIHLTPSRPYRGRVTIAIDGKGVLDGTATSEGLEVAGLPAEALVRRLAGGHTLTILSARGETVAKLSLAGTSAAFRFMDAEQGRAGGVTALVALGERPAGAVPAAELLPRVPAIRPGTGRPAPVSPSLLAAMRKRGSCDVGSGVDGERPEYHPLDGRSTLALIPCGSGAYNFNSVAFVIADGVARPAVFDVTPDWLAPVNGLAILTNAGWDARSGQLSHFDKGRGLGDCGTAQSYVWDGSRFRLVEARKLETCRGSIEWLTVYRALPVWR